MFIMKKMHTNDTINKVDENPRVLYIAYTQKYERKRGESKKQLSLIRFLYNTFYVLPTLFTATFYTTV